MGRVRIQCLFSVLLCFFLVLLSGQEVGAEHTVVLAYYYSASCGSCKPKTAIVEEIAQNYTGRVAVIMKEVGSNQTNREEWESYGFTLYPSAVINNETKIPKENITRENLELLLNSYLAASEENTIDTRIVALVVGVVVLASGAIMVFISRKQKDK